MLNDAKPPELSLIRKALQYEVFRRYGWGASAWRLLAHDLLDFAGSSYISNTAHCPLRLAESFSRQACGAGHVRVPVERYVLLIAFLYGDLSALKVAVSPENASKLQPEKRCSDRVKVTTDSKSETEWRRLYRSHRGKFSGMSRETGKSRLTLMKELAKHCPDLLIKPSRSAQVEDENIARSMFSAGAMLKEIAHATGLSPCVIYRVCHRDTRARDARNRSRLAMRREKFRRKARLLIDQGLTRQAINKRMGNAQQWMNRFDAHWVAKNYPARSKRPVSKATPLSSNWEKLDRELAAAVPRVAARLIEQQTHRVSQIKHGSLITAMRLTLDSRLPNTIAAIQYFSESQTSFRVRHVVHIFRKLLSRHGKPPSVCAISAQLHRPISELAPYLWLAGFEIDSGAIRGNLARHL